MEKGCAFCPLRSKASLKLSDEDRDKLTLNCAMVKFRKGDIVIRQGTLSTNVAYLISGLAKIHITGPYHEQVVRVVKAPSYLGLPTTFGDKINQYSVTVIENSEVCFIDINVFRHLLRDNPDFSYEIILDLCKSELEVYNRCANRTQKQIRGKIADVLIEFSEKIFNAGSFTLPLTQEEIGNLVDSSRESVSKVLTEFDKDGIIKVSAKKIEILNKKALLMISSKG